ncbi:MAG: hypothetical protein OXI69_07495 [Acidobacteriota bacterium]|nr:hypothetical protein [Acidobacteriota bacterium]
MTYSDDGPKRENEMMLKEIIDLERNYFFEKKNVKTERQRKLRELIERHINAKGAEDDS